MSALAGRAGLVTGGAAGIGRAIAHRLASDGAKVVVADNVIDGGEQTVRSIKEDGGEAIFVRTDVTDPQDVQAMVTAVVETFGSLDFAVNNAGIDGPFVPTGDYPIDDFDQVVAVNLRGVFLGMKSQLPAMIVNGGGAIVNVASIFGVRGFRNQPAYVASKHGVVGLTKAAALEYATSGLRINVVCPGAVRTPMVDRMLEDAPDMEAALIAMHPVGRLGLTDDVTGVVSWLCAEATPFMTGVVLPVDGGWTAA